MSKRPFQASFRWFAVEIAIVVVGVLIALGVDNWRDARRDRRLERMYLSRIVRDLQADTSEFHVRLREVPVKIHALNFLLAELPSGVEVKDTTGVLDAVVKASRYAWTNAPPRAATFEDLKSTGNLGLIRNDSLRDVIVRYYFTAEFEERRIEARRTDYGDLSYRLVPRGTTEFSALGSIAEGERKDIINRIISAHLIPTLVAERNFAHFFAQMQLDRLQRAEDLLRQLGA